MNQTSGVDAKGRVHGRLRLALVYLTIPFVRIVMEATLQVLTIGYVHDTSFSSLLTRFSVDLVLWTPAGYWLTRVNTKYYLWGYLYLGGHCLLSLISSAAFRNLNLSMGLQIVFVSLLASAGLLGMIRWQESLS